jgi:hypothetical protein
MTHWLAICSGITTSLVEHCLLINGHVWFPAQAGLSEVAAKAALRLALEEFCVAAGID